METEQDSGEKVPTIRRGKVDSLTLYEITDHELDVLERGSPNSIYLNFSIFLLSIAISFIVALLTLTPESNRVYYVLVIVSLISLIIGSFLCVLWYRTRQSSDIIIKKIKDRVQ